MEMYCQAKLLTEVLERFAGFSFGSSPWPHMEDSRKVRRCAQGREPVRGPFVYKQADEAKG